MPLGGVVASDAVLAPVLEREGDVELVADRETRAPAPPVDGLTRRLLAPCRRQGLILYGAGCIDGVWGDAVMVAPPLAATEADVAELLERLDRGLASMAAP